MSKIITKLSSKNQVTIPVSLMKELNFPPQTSLLLQVIDGKLVIKESKPPAKIARGFFKQFLVDPNFDVKSPSSDILLERKNSDWE